MTTPAPDYSGLLEKLEETFDGPGGVLVNPDGPEAAKAIRDLEADAMRYRFLRDRDPGTEAEPVPDGLFIGQVPENVILTGDEADAAIDEARSALSGSAGK